MDRVLERPAALDVHKVQVTACVRTPGEGGRRRQEVREFKTTVRGLLGLRDWLAGLGVTTVAMEATGVYWKPVWAILEDEFELLLCNASTFALSAEGGFPCLLDRGGFLAVGSAQPTW